MRRASTASERFSLIIPVHVASRLAMMSRETAERLRAELQAVAELAFRSEPSDARYGSELESHWVEANGVKVNYRLDLANRTMLAVNVEG